MMIRKDRGQAGEDGARFDKRQGGAAHQVSETVDEGGGCVVQALVEAEGTELQDLRPDTAQFLGLLAAFPCAQEEFICAREEWGEIQPIGTDRFAALHDREPLSIGAVAPHQQSGFVERIEMAAQLTIG